MVKVLICEDQTLVRKGLVALLESEPGITIVGEAVNGREAVEKTGAFRPDVVLMDVRMPIVDGIEATRIITARYPFARVIMLTTYESGEFVFEGVKAGAMGYLLKDASLSELVTTIWRVHEGECLIQPAVASSILFELARGQPRPADDPMCEHLSEREVAIVSRLANGLSNRDIANDLGLAEGTIKNNVSIILSKLHAANRVQAANAAREQKLI
jgi:DNA-binding NarL/FixJ family response regulator